LICGELSIKGMNNLKKERNIMETGLSSQNNEKNYVARKLITVRSKLYQSY
jgi:hypothetical protein